MNLITRALILSFLAAGNAYALDINQDCNFVAGWANKAFHISHTVGLAAENWHLENNGWTEEEYALLLQIKHEAYTDLPALKKRVEAACAAKEES